jgi:hypothetical protein
VIDGPQGDVNSYKAGHETSNGHGGDLEFLRRVIVVVDGSEDTLGLRSRIADFGTSPS